MVNVAVTGASKASFDEAFRINEIVTVRPIHMVMSV